MDIILSQIWADPVHQRPMVGYASGAIGVGVATGNDRVYITLDVRPGINSALTTPTGFGPSATPGLPNYTPVPPTPFMTATPLSNGAVVHVVSAGETLWAIAIAYGVKIDNIRQLNNLPAGLTEIYVGEKLTIRAPATGTPDQSDASATPRQSLTPRPLFTPRPTRTITVTSALVVDPTGKPLQTLSQKPPDSKSVGFNPQILLLGLAFLFVAVLLSMGLNRIFRK